MRKVIIWGHRPRWWNKLAGFALPSHTHSYIHAGYFRAFRELNFDTYWVNTLTEMGAVSLRDAIVLTEGQVDAGLPILPSANYVTHHSSRPEFLDLQPNFLRLHNFVADVSTGISTDYTDAVVTKLGEVAYWDEANRALYQPWATDLLPRTVEVIASNRTKAVNYIGTLNHDGLGSRFRILRDSASRLGLKFRHYQGVSDARARTLMASSFVTFDLRGDWHQKVGYIPCRLWKGMSYGRLMTTNSMRLAGVFGDRLNYEPDVSRVLESSIAFEDRHVDGGLVRDNVNWVLQNHTYVNRARQILDLI